MKVLLAGGAGFLGANLARKLVGEGHEVTILDNLFTGHRSNLEDPALKDCPFFEADIRDLNDKATGQPVSWQGDVIINLACPASPPAYQKDPWYTIETSFIGSQKLIRLALESKARYVFASTSEIYGDPLEHPQSEEYRGNVNTLGIRACYDEGKRAGETLVADAIREYGLDGGIIRIFNTYGPYMDPRDGRVVSNFINQALRGEDLTIYGDGSQTRSFCYVEDLINGIWEVSASKEKLGPYNLGNPGEFTILEFADLVLEMIPDTGSRKKFFPLPADDPKIRQPVIDRMKKDFGWQPRVNLRAGLERTIEYFRTLNKPGGVS